jgi:glycerol-3-phosphate O-acyltransferase 3/4
MIDYIILTQVTPFAAIAQQNKGWVGFLQNTAMDAIQCIRFNRTAGALYKFNPVYP